MSMGFVLRIYVQKCKEMNRTLLRFRMAYPQVFSFIKKKRG